MPFTKADLDKMFASPAPTADQEARYMKIRIAGHHLATAILECTTVPADLPPPANQTTAINKVREAVKTANAAIALDV